MMKRSVILEVLLFLLVFVTTTVDSFGLYKSSLSFSFPSVLHSKLVNKRTATTVVAMTASSSSSQQSKQQGLQEIEVVHQPDQEFLQKKGVFNWGTWGCVVSKFPWTYDESESCYLLQGKVTVTPSDGRKAVSFGKGDFVTFPAGMSCTWDVSEAVKKYYMFF